MSLILAVLFAVWYAAKKKRIFNCLMYFLSIGSISALRMLEVGFGSVPLFVSDENYYLSAGSNTMSWIMAEKNVLWLLVNKFILAWEPLGEYVVKLINLPLVVTLLIKLEDLFNSPKRWPVWLMLTPYIVVMATYNFRDVLILVAAIFAIDGLVKSSVSGKLIALIWMFILASLRMEMLFFILIIFIGSIIMRDSRPFRALFRAGCISICFLGINLVLLGDFWVHWFTNKALWLELVFTNADAMEARLGSYYSGNLVYNWAVGLVRYVLAPFPTSLIEITLRPDHYHPYGALENFVRLLQVLISYVAFAYIIIRRQSILSRYKNQNQAIQILIAFLLVHAVIYGFYGFGVGHPRIKLPFYLGIAALVLIDLQNYHHAKKREALRVS